MITKDFKLDIKSKKLFETLKEVQQYLKEPTNVTQKELRQLFPYITSEILTLMVKKGILTKYANGSRKNDGYRYIFEAPEVTRRMADKLLEDAQTMKKNWNINRNVTKPKLESIKSNDWIPIIITETEEYVVIKIHKSIKIEKTKLLQVIIQ